MSGLIREVRERPGDWIFLPFLLFGILDLSIWTIVNGLLIGTVINYYFGKKP